MGSLEMPSSGRKPPPRQVRTQEERARLGIAIASGLAVIFVVILAWVVLTNSGAPTRRPEELTPPPLRAPTASKGVLGNVEKTRLEFLDKNDRTRVASRVVFEGMDPLERGNYAIDQPDAWIYLKDGGAIHVRAQSGRFYMPDQTQEPENGRLAGDVVLDFYRRLADGRSVDPASDKPDATFKTRSLNFDSTLGSITTADPFTVTSQQIDLTGTGLDMLFSRAAQRLEMLQIAHGDAFVIHADRLKDGREGSKSSTPEPSVAQAPPPSAPPTARATTAAKPAETSPDLFYRTTFNDTVVVTQESHTIESDELLLWTHLIDGKIPAGAIASIRVARSEHPAVASPPRPMSEDRPPPGLASAELLAPAASLSSPTPSVTASAPPATSPGDIVVRWNGPCVVQPLDAKPNELARDQVALRFSTTSEDRIVRARDSVRRAVVEGAAIDYGATSRRLSLSGTESKLATLDIPETGNAEASRIEADLTTGLIHMAGRSRFTMASRDGTSTPGPLAQPQRHQSASQLSCTRQADLTLEVVDGEVTNTLKQATFEGDVRIAQIDSSLTAQFVRADFARSGSRPNVLTRLIAQGDAEIGSTQSGNAGQIHADSIDIAFNPASTSSTPEPQTLTAERNVRVQREEEHLSAGFLEATLAHNDRGGVDVLAARAHDAIEYANLAQGVSMQADEMHGDFALDPSQPSGRRQVLDLVGQKVVLARGNETTVTGTQMRLDGQGPRIQVFGPGEFTHRQARAAEPAGNAEERLVEAHATWTGGMTFDDSTGVLTCDGGAIAIAAPDAVTRDRFEGEHVTLTLAPRESGGTSRETSNTATTPSHEQRRVVSARATGSILDRPEGTNARVESRKYASAVPAIGSNTPLPPLEQAVYLEGPSIAADNTSGTLDVPAAGRLLLRDARERTEVAAAADKESSPDGRGDALFDWDGSMRYRRDVGQIELTRNVRLTHRRLQDAMVTNLRCDRLIAGVNVPTPGTPSKKEEHPQLTSVNATGSVYVSSGPASKAGQTQPPQRELSADMVDYDTIRAIVAARANPGAFISFIDTSRGSPLTASSIIWNLIDDRVTVDAPQPITAPR